MASVNEKENTDIKQALQLNQEKISPNNITLNRNKRDSVFNKDVSPFYNINERECGYSIRDQEYQKFILIQDSVTGINNNNNNNNSQEETQENQETQENNNQDNDDSDLSE